MSHSSFRRRIAVVVLGMVLAAPLAMASQIPSRSESGTARSADFSTQASWDLLPRIWSVLFGAWSKNGCSIDPFGFCLGQQAGSNSGSTKNGCSVDPDGHCVR